MHDSTSQEVNMAETEVPRAVLHWAHPALVRAGGAAVGLCCLPVSRWAVWGFASGREEGAYFQQFWWEGATGLELSRPCPPPAPSLHNAAYGHHGHSRGHHRYGCPDNIVGQRHQSSHGG